MNQKDKDGDDEDDEGNMKMFEVLTDLLTTLLSYRNTKHKYIARKQPLVHLRTSQHSCREITTKLSIMESAPV